MAFAGCVAVLGLLVLPEAWARTRVFDARPRVGLVVWAATCVLGWTGALSFFLVVALGGAHGGLGSSLALFARRLSDGHPLRGLGLSEVVGLSLAFDIAVLFTGGLVVTALRAWGVRARQRTVLDLVATPGEGARALRYLPHPLPVAYYLPGDGGRVVLSTGTMDVLSRTEVEAVIAHEFGHRHGLHGSLLVPLQVLSSFVPFLPLARRAPAAMRSLLEMSADDYSRSRVHVGALRSALTKAVVFQPPPRGAFGAFTDAVERRIRRLDAPTTPGLDAVLVVVIASASLSVLGALVTLH